jgi:phage terminase Nu1 subunit (DNA packaging protein)
MTGTELSKLFDCTLAYLPQLVEAGMPKETDGSYDLSQVIPWYVRHLRDAKKTGEAQAKARLAEAKASLAEMDLRTKQENLINVDDAVLEVGELFSAIRSQMIALPSKVAPQLIACETPGEAEGLLMKYINQTLEELSTLPERLEALQDEISSRELQSQSQSDTEEITEATGAINS